MNRMDALARWVLFGLCLIALIGALRWITYECKPDDKPGPTIGSVIKLWGC